ncbi:unnamed protein product [Paramecium octaurelia]|uniref:Transmembrane protein n=1 Tax=Paramecium octaurelia TaxID=43137 RepID=A0A8S1UI67_PAROT|nr:unnamed protein product [Paramecium octaurelia]
MKFLIILVSCQLAFGLQIHYSEQICPCSEYSQNICDLSATCSWNGESCQDLDCQDRNSTFCLGSETNFKCIWDQKFEECQDFDYEECDQISNEKDCADSYYYTNISCSWTHNMKCEKFDCSNSYTCPFNNCSYINGVCSNPTKELNCQTLPKDQCNFNVDGNGQMCYLNDYGQCDSLNFIEFVCPLLDDSQDLCLKSDCVYENNKCRKKVCADIKLQEECYFLQNGILQFITTCFWQDNSCQEVQQEDLHGFSRENCQIRTAFTYSWSDNNECQKCVLLQKENESVDEVLPIVLGITIPLSVLLILTCIFILWCKKKQKFCFKPDQRNNYEAEIQKDEKKSSDNNFTQRLKLEQIPAL